MTDAARPPDGATVPHDGGHTSGEAGARADAGQGDAGGRGDSGAPSGFDADDWQRRVIYMAMPDRFANGDPTNDDVGQADCFDPSNGGKFHGGDLRGLRDHLDYLGALGVGALWTTPLQKQISSGRSCGYHGYWADLKTPDDGALEPKLGTLKEAQALIGDLHDRKIKYIADLVVNHCSRAAELRNEHQDWFHPPRPACAQLGVEEVYCDLSGLPDFAQENPDTAAYLTALTRGWVKRLDVDGIRMDTIKHVAASYFADSWVPGVLAERADLFLLGEHLTGSLIPYQPYFDAGFHSMFHFPLRTALVDALAKNGSLNGVAERVRETIDMLGIARARRMTLLLDNHDIPRFLSEAGDLPVDERMNRYRLALAALFTLPGIPQIYYGDELGMVGPDNRRDMPAWAFDTQARKAHAADAGYTKPDETFALLAALSKLRAEHAALHAGAYAEMWRPGTTSANMLAFLRTQGDDRVLVVIHAGDGDSGTVALRVSKSVSLSAADKAALPDGTKLTRVAGHGAPGSITVEAGELHVQLPAKSFGIFALTR